MDTNVKSSNGMGVSITVLYPKTSDSDFDLDYYTNVHMPRVAKEFTPYGLKGYRVISLKTIVTGYPSPYSVQLSLEFDSIDQFKEALNKTGQQVLGDMPQFSNKDPILVVGDEILNLDSTPFEQDT